MFTENDKRNELIAWAKNGIHDCLREIRGTHMFGSRASVKAVDCNTLEITTYEVGVSGPIYWEIKLRRKV